MEQVERTIDFRDQHFAAPRDRRDERPRLPNVIGERGGVAADLPRPRHCIAPPDNHRISIGRGDNPAEVVGQLRRGLLFLGGQFLAWQQLKSAGVFISSNPSSSFFYVLTASHAFHLLGGVIALIYVDVQALLFRLGPAKRTAVDISAVFWHFLDGLWLYLMLLFYVWG